MINPHTQLAALSPNPGMPHGERLTLNYGESDRVANWVGSRIPWVDHAEEFGKYFAVGIERDGQLIGGVVWHNYMPRFGTIHISCAADTARWLSRRLLREIFVYPFGHLGCQRVGTVTPKTNEHALRINRKLGFKYEGTVRRGFGGDDAVIMGLLLEEWLGSYFGPERA